MYRTLSLTKSKTICQAAIMAFAVFFIWFVSVPSASAADFNVFGGGGGGGSEYDNTSASNPGGAGGSGGSAGNNDGARGLAHNDGTAFISGGAGGGAYAGSSTPAATANATPPDVSGPGQGGIGYPVDGTRYNGAIGGNRFGPLQIDGGNAEIADSEHIGGTGGVAGTNGTRVGGKGGDGGGRGGEGLLGPPLSAGEQAPGAGGGGGGASMDWQADDISANAINVRAGSGGNGAQSGAGGGGNAILRSAGTVHALGAITLAGGNGGHGAGSTVTVDNPLGGGGGGGGAMYDLTGATISAGSVTMSAGAGGNGATATGGGGGGGHVVVAGDGATMTVTGMLTVQAGAGGQDATQGGAGGNARFSMSTLNATNIDVKSGLGATGQAVAGNTSFAVGALSTRNADFTQQTGTTLDTAIDELAVSAQAAGGTGLTFNATESTRTKIATITFSNASALRIDTTANAGMQFDVIRVSGKNSTYNAAASANALTLDARGKTMEFDLTGINKSETLLSANSHITINDTTRVTMVNIDQATFTQTGDQVTLIDSMSAVSSWTTQEYVEGVGAMEYEFSLAKEGQNLVNRLDNIHLNLDKGKNLVMGSAARNTLLYDSGNLMFETAIPNAIEAARASILTGHPRKVIFAAASWADSEFDTGSHIKTKNANAIIGLAVPCVAGVGIGTLGPFIEGGYGEYDAHNFDSYNNTNIRADGDTYHFGGGLYGRFDFNAGLFVEASARAGRVVTDYTTTDMGANRVDFDTGTWYAGGHAGLGWNFCFDECNTWTPYAYGMAFRQGKDKYNTNTGDVIDVGNADSLRLRAGLRYTHRFGGDGVKVYVGGAWEREFKGEVKADINGVRLTDNPTFRGDSAMAEVGAKWNCGSGWEFDIGARGYLGRREGFSVNAAIGRVF